MVAPFKPYVKHLHANKYVEYNGYYIDTRVYDLRFDGVSQAVPYVNTAYHGSIQKTLAGQVDCTGWNSQRQDFVDEEMVFATNKAYAWLVGELGDASSFGATLTAERRETYGMLKDGVVNVFLAAKAVKKGKLVEAARILGVAPPVVKTYVKSKRSRGKKSFKIRRDVLVLPDGREVSHSLANKWLWYSYGVKPLMGDIYNAMDVLQRDIPWTKIEGNGKSIRETVVQNSSSYYEKFLCICRAKNSINVRLKNPNLFLANQMGLTNPSMWLLEGIPFSFVVDWFSNLSQVVSQMTDFVGVETDSPMTATKAYFYRYGINRWQWKIIPVSVQETEHTFFNRKLALVPPEFRFRYEPFSWRRGANAISLLVSFLKKNGR